MIPAQPNKRITDQVTEWKSAPAVLSVEPNTRVYVDPVPDEFNEGVQPFAVNDPLVSQQYSLERMSVPTAWNSTRGDGVTVAIVDTGADFTHPDLAGKFVSRGRDFVNNDQDATDDHGHGTHVSGIASAVTNNGQGIAGVAPNARLLPVKVLSSTGSGDNAAVASGITWAADQGAKVINLSLGGGYPSATVQAAVDYAWGKGAVVVCAAGNTGASIPQYPAAFPNCVSVSATDSADRLASFSTYGDTVDVAAPGVQVLSTVRGGRYEAWSGTSMATPNVAGVVALIWAAHPTWTAPQVRAALENGADAVGPAAQVGKGRVNAARAVGSAAGPTLTPAPTSVFPTATPVPDRDAQIVARINQQRAAQGLGALTADPALVAVARDHNQFMDEHNCFNHECPGEETVWQRLARAGYGGYAGSEVIARGYDTVEGLVNGWLGSPAHRAIILGDYTHIGCAWDEFGTGYMGRWMTCDLGRRSGAAPPTATPALWGRAQPPGWFVVIEVPYDTSTQAQIDELYRNLCRDRKVDGVQCVWRQYRSLEVGP